MSGIKPLYLTLTVFLSIWTTKISCELTWSVVTDKMYFFVLLYLVIHYLRGYVLFFGESLPSSLSQWVDLSGLGLWCWGIFLLFRQPLSTASSDLVSLTQFLVFTESCIRLSPCLALCVALLCLLVARNFRSAPANQTGAPLGVVAKLRTGQGDRSEICPICLADTFAQTATYLPCGHEHVFHSVCIAQWLQQSCLCPVCRANIVDLVGANQA